jgi:lipopolysaccharide export system protein LptA
VIGKQAVQITHRDQKVQFQANQGQFNLKTSQANLSGNVRGVGQKPPFKLNTNQLDWNLETQVLLAVGAVVYEQAEPRVTLTGDRATGQLKQNKLVVSGTKQKPVTTKVIP